MVVLALTVLPRNMSAHRFKANGMMQTLATSYANANWQPASRSAAVNVGFSNEWSIILEMSEYEWFKADPFSVAK